MAENLFSCLTPFSETYELRGYIFVEINGITWIDSVACLDAVIQTFVEKQSLVDDDQSIDLISIALCSVNL